MASPTHPVILGLWPIAGVTTVGVTEADARATIEAAIDAGVTSFDTAFSYGYEGESDRLIGSYLRDDRQRFRLIGKVGQRWTADRKRVVDASADQLTRDAETSLRRMGLESFDLLMLHAPDPGVPLEVSAEALARLQARGRCREVGLCNADSAQRRRFAQVVSCSAIQCPLNLLQRDSQADLIPDAAAADSDVHVYWTLMKGLLAGKITRDHRFPPGDSRPGYDVFQGETRRRAHDVIDRLAELGREGGKTVAQLAIGWVLSQPGVTAALVGARRPAQIRETAAAEPLDAQWVTRIDRVVAEAFADGPRAPDGES